MAVFPWQLFIQISHLIDIYSNAIFKVGSAASETLDSCVHRAHHIRNQNLLYGSDLKSTNSNKAIELFIAFGFNKIFASNRKNITSPSDVL